MTQIKKILADLQMKVNKRLDSYLRDKIRVYRKSFPLTGKMLTEARSFIMGDGKRIRPIFVYFGYLAAGGRDKKAILDAAIFAELIHDYFLVHDDIIDQDELRHGLPSLHTRYERFYRDRANARHLGLSAAILAGDLISVLGYDVLSGSRFGNDLKNKAVLELNRIIEHVIAGQTMDVFLGVERELDFREITDIQIYKTSRYTVDGPTQIGAILAGADDRTLKQISRYAIPLGIAFQIQDDILGMFGDTKKTGKPSGADLREGKQTLLILRAKEKANCAQKKIIEKSLGNPGLTRKQLKAVRKIIVETGAFKYSQDLARKFVDQAHGIVNRSDFPPAAKDFLGGIGDYIIGRDK